MCASKNKFIQKNNNNDDCKNAAKFQDFYLFSGRIICWRFYFLNRTAPRV